ncbi:MAG: DsbA family protein [Candidatus Dojkabacteria bacterium]|jgi:protein-disulfide isomerase
MAKAKKALEKNEVIEINLDSFAVPIAIVVAGIIIALAIFFVNKGSNAEVEGTQSAPSVQGQQEQTQNEDAEVTVSIGDSLTIGDRNKAKIAIVEYSNFGCGYCQRHAIETYPEIKSKYIDSGEVLYVFKNLPFSEEGTAYNSALALHCVGKLADADKAVEFHSKAFDFATDEDIKNAVVALGVNAGKYDACMANPDTKSAIAAERDEGSGVGITGTPGFVVGKIDKDGKVTGPIIRGAYPLSTFEATIKKLSK